MGEMQPNQGARLDIGPITDVDAVILAGAVGCESRWTRGIPRPLLPLPGTTLVEALLSRLTQSLVGQYAVCANGRTDTMAQYLDPHVTVPVRYYEDRLPRGTAGCLKDCAAGGHAETIFFAGGSVWLEDDPAWMVKQHLDRRNALTVFCRSDGASARLGNRRFLRPAGLYCCDRVVLDYIKSAGYQDLKEQTVPALRQAGLRVGVVALQNETCEVSDWAGYLRVISRCLTTGLFGRRGFHSLAPGIWAGDDVKIGKNARIAGPAILGHRCRIADGAVLVGPVVLGDDSSVGRDAWAIRMIASGAVHVPSGARIKDQLVLSSDPCGADEHLAGHNRGTQIVSDAFGSVTV